MNSVSYNTKWIMNSENGKISEPYRLLLNLADKINLKRKDMSLYQILACTIHGEYQKIIYIYIYI